MTKADMTTIQNVVRFPKGSPLIDWTVLFLAEGYSVAWQASQHTLHLNTTMI
jgi:hypothetical protein